MKSLVLATLTLTLLIATPCGLMAVCNGPPNPPAAEGAPQPAPTPKPPIPSPTPKKP